MVTNPIDSRLAALTPHDSAVRADGVAQLALTLARELWTIKDRLMVLEAALTTTGHDLTALVDGYQPSDALRARLETERQRFVGEVVAALQPPGDRR
jgi:hypothetical protein